MALTANRTLKWGVCDNQEAYNVLTNVHIYKNAFVGWSGAAARPLVAGDIFLGLADTEENNTVNALGTGVGATGDRIVRVNREGVIYSAAVTGAAAATDLGKAVYASDDGTLTLTATSNSRVGKITKYISTGVADVYFDVDDLAPAGITALAGTLTGTVNGTIVDVAAAAAATAGGATPTAAQVDAGIATAVAPIVTGVNEQLKEIQTTLNAVIAAIRA